MRAGVHTMLSKLADWGAIANILDGLQRREMQEDMKSFEQRPEDASAAGAPISCFPVFVTWMER